MKTKLKPYRGKLSAEQIVDGMNTAVRNARRLAEDAKTMLDLKRYPTAVSLAILSIEESGKVPILRNMAVTPDKKAVRFCWNRYKDHQSKNRDWPIPTLTGEDQSVILEKMRLVTDPESELPVFLDDLKKISLYTDCLDNVHWSEPEKKISEESALEFVNIADRFANLDVPTLKEVELFIEHLKPVIGSSSGNTKEDLHKALYNWRKSLIREGLRKEDDTLMEAFYREYNRGLHKEDT